MLNCEDCEKYIADALYAPLERRDFRAIQSHLDRCVSCRGLMEEMCSAAVQLRRRESVSARRDIALVDDRPMATLWDDLQVSLNAIDADRFRQAEKKRFSRKFTGAFAVAACLVLLISVTIPALIERPTVSDAGLDQLISRDLISYLNRAEVMLMMVANAESDGITIIPMRNAFARDMALQASNLSVSMADQINSGQHRLLGDIEYLLLQIANLDESNMVEGVALLQEYLEQNSVMFKIRLLEMRNRDSLI